MTRCPWRPLSELWNSGHFVISEVLICGCQKIDVIFWYHEFEFLISQFINFLISQSLVFHTQNHFLISENTSEILKRRPIYDTHQIFKYKDFLKIKQKQNWIFRYILYRNVFAFKPMTRDLIMSRPLLHQIGVWKVLP